MLCKPKELCENLIEKYFCLLDKWKCAGLPYDETMVMPLDDYYNIAKTGNTIEIRDNRTGVCVARVTTDNFAKQVGQLFKRYLTLYFGREP